MATNSDITQQDQQKNAVKYQGGASDTVYAFGLIGAWVYYIGHAKTFQEGVVGFFKGFVWPALLVYALLEFLDKD